MPLPAFLGHFVVLWVVATSPAVWAKFEEPCQSLLGAKFGSEASENPKADSYRNPETGYFFKRMATKYRVLDPLWMTGAYPSEEHLVSYEVQVLNGRLMWRGRSMGSDRCKLYNYVMLSDGRIFADIFMAEIPKLHHSALARGKPVSAAGEMRVCDGVLNWLSNKSGHYMPPTGFHSQFLHRLNKLGYSGPIPTLYDAEYKELLNVPEIRQRALKDIVEQNSKLWHLF